MIPRGDDEPALSQHTQMVGHQILLDRYFLHQVGDGQGGFPERPDDRQSYGMGNKVEARGAGSGNVRLGGFCVLGFCGERPADD